MTIGIRGAFVAAMLALGACKAEPNDNVCITPPSVIGAERGDWQGCVHRWSYRLAQAPGASSEIANAAISGCHDAITARADENKSAVNAPEAFSESLEREETNARRWAAFYVVQARAGQCWLYE